MNSLISVNSKFMVLTPMELTALINKSEYTKGIELCIDFDNEFQRKYINDLVYEIKKYNLILQIHGDIEMDFDKQLEYMQELERYSDLLGYPIVITMHPIYDENKEISLIKTRDYLDELINKINTNKIVIALENLNDARGFIRLNKEDITNTIFK